MFKVHGSEHMMAGLPDLIICYRGLFIALEVKMPGNKVSPVQSLRIQQIRAAQGHAYVVKSVQAALKVLDLVDSVSGGA